MVRLIWPTWVMIIRKELSHAMFAYISLAGRKWIVDLDCNRQSHPGKDVTVNRGEVSAGRSEVPWEDIPRSVLEPGSVAMASRSSLSIIFSPKDTRSISTEKCQRGSLSCMVTHIPSFYLKEEILPNSPPTSFLVFIFYVYGCFTWLYACVRVPGWNWSCKLL